MGDKGNIKKPFGTSVKPWRSELGNSRQELGERAGPHRTSIPDIQRGVRNVSLASFQNPSDATARLKMPWALLKSPAVPSSGQQ